MSIQFGNFDTASHLLFEQEKDMSKKKFVILTEANYTRCTVSKSENGHRYDYSGFPTKGEVRGH